MKNLEMIKLPRGGIVLKTKEGFIQFGSPPETVKDTMVLPCGVPRIFVMPQDFFHPHMGISLAEIEFPIYYNFFLKNQKVIVLCPEEFISSVKIAMTEAVFGPVNMDVSQDYPSDTISYQIPNIKKEVLYFQSNLNLDNLVEFIPVIDGKANVGSVEIKLNHDKQVYVISESGIFLTEVPAKVDFIFQYEVGKTVVNKFIPPRMGMTCLGSSHGFDPTQNTSGFILWLNSCGIMIDPPVASTEWLNRSNVNPKYIDTIILTHCHADHDAGAFQKILAEGKIDIYTTKTIMDSFLKKYSALINIPSKELLQMFNFYPITIGKPIHIHQGLFNFSYSLHSIPTIGFQVNYRGKTLVYSSDHINNPELVKDMFNKGFINKYRYENLMNFPWHSDVIYHEAGIPPIHTPISYLNKLPIEIQKKIYVYHIAEKDFPKNTHLTLSRFGIDHTNVIKVPEYSYDDACHILNVLEKVEFFNSFNLPNVAKLLSVLNKEYFSKNSVIIEKGSVGDKFYIIISGKVSVQGLEDCSLKSYGEYDVFGEVSLLLGEKRTASVIAESEVEAITIEKYDFLNLLEGTKLKDRLLNLSKSRNVETWMLLSESRLFKNTTSFQKTAFEVILNLYKPKNNEMLMEIGKPFNFIYMISSGKVMEIDGTNKITVLERGNLVGNVFTLQKGLPSNKTYIAGNECSLYQINREDMLEYVETYPNIYINLHYLYHN